MVPIIKPTVVTNLEESMQPHVMNDVMMTPDLFDLCCTFKDTMAWDGLIAPKHGITLNPSDGLDFGFMYLPSNAGVSGPMEGDPDQQEYEEHTVEKDEEGDIDEAEAEEDGEVEDEQYDIFDDHGVEEEDGGSMRLTFGRNEPHADRASGDANEDALSAGLQGLDLGFLDSVGDEAYLFGHLDVGTSPARSPPPQSLATYPRQESRRRRRSSGVPNEAEVGPAVESLVS